MSSVQNNRKPSGKYRNYELSDLFSAAKSVACGNITIYKATKLFGVPYNTLKKFISDNEDIEHPQVLKMGRPFALPSDIELRVFNFIIEMQELGFGLTVMQVRKLAYDLAESVNRQHLFNHNKKIASKWWWSKFKERYNLSLRVPENLSAYRATMSNPVIIEDYFVKLNALLCKLGIKDQPSRIWNVDETGLAYVVKPSKVVCQVGKKYVYKRTYGERGQIHTLVGCACADGTFIPPMIIFKGVRWNDSLKNNQLPNSLVRLSPKGWINGDLFLEWFRFFIDSIHAARPVVLLMDSHSAHIGPEIIQVAKDNQVFIMTFPPHTSHLLQPLDVGVYKSLKSKWSKELNNFMLLQPNNKPDRSNFHDILNPAFLDSFSPSNIINAFRKSGACPFNASAVSQEALAPSRLTENRLTDMPTSVLPTKAVTPSSTLSRRPSGEPRSPEEEATINQLLRVPHFPKSQPRPAEECPPTKTRKTTTQQPKGKKDKSARCLNPPQPESSIQNPQPSCSGTQTQPTQQKTNPSKKGQKKYHMAAADDWECGVCFQFFSVDVAKKTGAKWIQCSFCRVPYHEQCQKSPNDDTVYMCDMCEGNSDSDDCD